MNPRIKTILPAALLLALSAPPTLAGGGTTCAVGATENNNMLASTPMADFTDHFDGTVTHDKTGLMWAKCSQGQMWEENTANDDSDDACSGGTSAHNWQAALAQAQTANGANFLGYNDWRLPNANELESIVERRCFNPAINAAIFPNTPGNFYWSSSPYAGNSSFAWGVFFRDGGVFANVKDIDVRRVRLVRAGQ